MEARKARKLRCKKRTLTRDSRCARCYVWGTPEVLRFDYVPIPKQHWQTHPACSILSAGQYRIGFVIQSKVNVAPYDKIQILIQHLDVVPFLFLTIGISVLLLWTAIIDVDVLIASDNQNCAMIFILILKILMQKYRPNDKELLCYVNILLYA